MAVTRIPPVVYALLLLTLYTCICYAFLDAGFGCPKGSFMCTDGDCIRNSKRCDGVRDCREGNDEWDCELVRCEAPEFFRCDNKRCISSAFVCDGENDCGDESDERKCDNYEHPDLSASCSSKEFQCEDKLCIPKKMVCDGVKDCIDGSDETSGCTAKISCEDGFLCKNKHCIPLEFRCDGSADCADESDEQDCHMITHNVPLEDCVPERGLFACVDKVGCLEMKHVCDGNSHCLDDSDENGKCAETCESINCTRQCHRTPNGPVCICPSGTRFNNSNCVEYDECSSFGICDHRCRSQPSKPNGYECYCDAGYLLQDDKRSCRAEGGEALMVFSAGSQIRGLYLTSEVLFKVADKLGQVAGIGFDGHHIYWTNVAKGGETVMRSNEDGSQQEVIISAGLGLPEDLAVDWITQNIYFTDSQRKHVGVCNSDGSSCTVLVNNDIDQPRSIAVLPFERTMFWSDWGSKPMIATSGMDGSNPQVLVSSDIHWPNGISVDYHNNRLYWVDAKRRKIETVKLDGTDRRVVLERVLKHPFDIAVFEGSLYWSDWEGKQIQACDKFTGKNQRTIIRERRNKVYGVHIFHSSMQHRNVSNPCVDSGCSDICLLAPNPLGYTCACPLDRSLGADKHACHEVDKRQMVVVAAGHSLILVETRVLGKLGLVTVPLRAIHKMGPIAYNALSGSMLIADVVQKKIFSFNLKSTRLELLVGNAIGSIVGMDFDAFGNNLYWCDSEKSTVEVVSLNTHERSVLLRDLDGEVPLDVAVVPYSGVMFVAFSSDRGVHIDRFSMDGSGRMHIIESRLEGQISLWYDIELDRVFWSDSDTGIIDSTSVEGIDRHAFRVTSASVVDITTTTGDVYWVEKHSNVLRWADKYDGYAHAKKMDLAFSEGLDFVRLVGVRGILSGGSHPCQKDNGGCSHLCLLSHQSVLCACPDGMVLQHNNHTCVTPIHCTPSQFRCRADDMCISKGQRCNGKRECPSGEDEENCKPVCRYGQFACENGQCIDEALACDGSFDCTDKSDETNCKVVACDPDTQFTCSSGQCISLQWRCNFFNDCHDGSDEENCEDTTCDPGRMFRCKSGACVPKTWECDGEVDCSDGSDEHGSCAPPPCEAPDFLCSNKVCIDGRLKCDGHDDCGDDSDESGCVVAPTLDKQEVKEGADKVLVCAEGEFKCTSQPKCLPAVARCNSSAECMGGEDEMDCKECDGHEFQCRNHLCIPTSWLCDKYNDCGDNSDEDLKECRADQPSPRFESSKKCTTFQCPSGECLPWNKVCNIHEDCPDSADEGGRCVTACSEGHPCSGLCVRTPHGPHCSCEPGYQLKGDGRSCEDVNECDEDDPCSQLCENIVGSFSCSCGVEYILRSDKVSCKATGPAMLFFYSSGEQIRKVTASLSRFSIVAENSGLEISGLDVDARAEHVYWTTEQSGILHRMSLGTGVLSHVRGLGVPSKLAVDWLTKNVYFSNKAEQGSISVCNLEVKNCSKLIKGEDGTYVSSIAVDPMSGLLFWSAVTPVELATPISQIFVSDLAGQNKTVIVSGNMALVSGIALDLIKRRMFWADQHLGVIEQADYSGSGRIMIRNYEVYHPVGLSLFEDALYWTTAGTGMINVCRLYGRSQACRKMELSKTDVKHVSIMQRSRQPLGENPCLGVNCTHMCVISQSGPKCICSDGSTSRPGKLCKIADTDTDLPVQKPSFHMVVETNTAYSSSKTESSSSILGPVVTVMFVIGLAIGLFAYKRRSAPGSTWPNLLLGLNIGKLGGDSGNNMTFDNQAFGMSSSSRPDPFQPSMKPGEHEYENPASLQERDGKLSLSKTVQSWTAPKRKISVDNIQLEDDSDSEYVDGENDQNRLLP